MNRKQKRSTLKPGATRINAKRLLLLSLLIIVPVILSGCYVEPDRFINDDGLNAGQQFDPQLTATPEVTATPTPAPTQNTGANWDDWTFGGDTATNPPSNVNQIGDTPLSTGGIATAVPQNTISGTASSETLKRGSSGDAVTQLQSRLKELGYYSGTIDGKYGPSMETAVRAFQAANRLTADGVAGQKTQEAVYSFYAIKASDASSSSATKKPAANSTAKPTVGPVSGKTNIYLRLGDSGPDVKTMQNRLISLGYLSGSADGQFQETTQAAVMAFQRKNSLDADGVAGPTTLSKLYSSSAKKADSVVANIGPLQKGMSGSAVRSLQQQLKNLGFYSGSVDGDYGAGTEAAVMAFQRAYGLGVDGVAGTTTQNAIYGSGGSGVVPPSNNSTKPDTYGVNARTNGTATISASSNNSPANVTALQSVLQSRNYYSGALDGSYGAGTTSAVSNYQRAAGLRVTGMAGPTTQRLLFGGTSESGSYTKLDVGSSGGDVRNLQYTLYELMYYDGDITGVYDEATRNAVLLFQQVNGLSVDGVAGEATQRRLYSSNALPCNS